MTLEAIRSDFAFLDDWEDRYRYVIEFGRRLPPLPDAYRTDRYKVSGCTSQVWLANETERRADDVAMLAQEHHLALPCPLPTLAV
jgi:cysteine desulfuration protein SufE